MIELTELKRRRIAVLMGGHSQEREISLRTGKNVLAALEKAGYQAVALDVTDDLAKQLQSQKIDLVYIALHGRFGEDGCMQGFLETLRIPYTGSGVLASALAMDKVMTKRFVSAAGMPTPAWRYPATLSATEELGFPLVIKPSREGSSVGLTVLQSGTGGDLQKAIERAGGPDQAMAERFVPGQEISVAVVGSGDAARALGSVEIRPAQGLYDYEAKYQRNDTQYLVPPTIPAPVVRRCEEFAVATHRILGCSGGTRLDLRWNGNEDPTILELNTLPGMTETSLLPKIAAHAGISYIQLVELIAADAALKA